MIKIDEKFSTAERIQNLFIIRFVCFRLIESLCCLILMDYRVLGISFKGGKL